MSAKNRKLVATTSFETNEGESRHMTLIKAAIEGMKTAFPAVVAEKGSRDVLLWSRLEDFNTIQMEAIPLAEVKEHFAKMKAKGLDLRIQGNAKVAPLKTGFWGAVESPSGLVAIVALEEPPPARGDA